MRDPMRDRRVLPEPAPARMQTGPRTASAARRCSGLRPASTSTAPAYAGGSDGFATGLRQLRFAGAVAAGTARASCRIPRWLLRRRRVGAAPRTARARCSCTACRARGGELVQLTDCTSRSTGSTFRTPAAGSCCRWTRAATSGGSSTCSSAGSGARAVRRRSGFIHRSERTSLDGRLVAYASNRRNGVDFDISVRDPDRRGAPVLAELGGCVRHGRVLARRALARGVDSSSDRSGDNDLYLGRRRGRRGGARHAARRRGGVRRAPWRAAASFLFATNAGRDTIAIARFDVEAADSVRARGRVGSRLRRRPNGRHLLVDANEDGYSPCRAARPARHSSCARERAAAGTRRRAAVRVLPDGRCSPSRSRHRVEPGRRLALRHRSGRDGALTRSARRGRARVDAGTASCTASTRSTASRSRSSCSGPTVHDPVPVDRQHPRRPGGAGCRPIWSCGEPVLRLARVRGSGAERARLHGLRQAVRAARRPPDAARLGARPRRAARLARGARTVDAIADGALRAARTAATWCSRRSRSTPSGGRPASTSSASPASSRSSRTRRCGGAPFREREYGYAGGRPRVPRAESHR